MNNEKQNKFKKFLHESFEFTLFLKAIDAVLELITGILLLFLNPEIINCYAILFTQKELGEDPKDIVANFLLKIAHSISIGSLLFASLYMISHAVIKIGLIIALWKRKLWAYPVAIFVFILFIIYQMYRFSHGHAIYLIYLTILDILVIILTWSEYKRIKHV